MHYLVLFEAKERLFMAKLPVISLILISSVLLAACSAAGGAERRVNAPSDGQVIEVGVGDELVLELAGNPTTGYNWYVTDGDGSILQVQGEPEFTADSSAIGSGGVLALSFKALAVGETTLSLAYQRAWEVGIPPLETLTLQVVVK